MTQPEHPAPLSSEDLDSGSHDISQNVQVWVSFVFVKNELYFPDKKNIKLKFCLNHSGFVLLQAKTFATKKNQT